jgi:cephalosporin hydroxylase
MTIDFLINLRRKVFDAVAWRLSKHELHKLMERRGLEEIIGATQDYIGRGFYARIHAVQVPSEIKPVAQLVQKLRPKTIVEIGTFKGGTLFVWCRTNPQAELFVSIDLPGGRYGGGYDRRRRRLYQEFLADRPQSRMVLVQADSHLSETLEELKTALQERLIDLLYVDGDHTYEGVKKDYELYSPLVRKGGVVAFHDIATRSQNCGVHQLWDELKRTRRTQEFVGDSSNKGIGVAYID